MTDYSVAFLEGQLASRRLFWRPRTERIDYWHALFLLIDAAQMVKDLRQKRFISNHPENVVRTAVNVVARNPLQFRIPLSSTEDASEKDLTEKLEKMFIGLFNDIDYQAKLRGEPAARYTAAWYALLRGAIVTRLLLTSETHSPSPVDMEFYDWRTTYPTFGKYGIVDCLYESVTSLGECMDAYPDMMVDADTDDLHTRVTKLEYFDRNIHCVSSTWTGPRASQHSSWLVPPYGHGVYNAKGEGVVPVIFVPANAVPLHSIPSHLRAYSPFQDLNRPLDALTLARPWLGAGGWVAHAYGRSILAAIEDEVPQFNELVATLWQIMDNDAFGTWVAKTPTGEQLDVDIGSGAVNYLRNTDSLQNIRGMSASPDLYRLLDLMNNLRQQGTFPDLLYALGNFPGSGFLFTQMQQAAMNAISPYVEAYETWGQMSAMRIQEQLRGSDFSSWEVWGQTPSRRLFRMDFDPAVFETLYPVEAKATPALPFDLMTRAQIARIMLDPRRPIASIETVFDRVLEWPDALAEKDRIFEDIADTDPVIALERIRQVFIKRGMEDVAQYIGQKEFALAFIQEAQQKAAVAQAGAVGRPEGEGGPPSPSPEVSPPETTRTTEGGAPTPAGGASPPEAEQFYGR